MTVHRDQILKREREKNNKMQQSDVYYQHCLNMFRASISPSSGEQRLCVTACGVLRWFCWMWNAAPHNHYQPHPALLAPYNTAPHNHYQPHPALLTPYNAAPHNRYQPHPSEPAQHTACSNTRSYSPDDVHNDARNMLRQC